MTNGAGVPREIERKFLVADDSWRGDADAGCALLQAYLCETDRAVVRVRISGDGGAFLTIKSAEAGLSRDEFEYAVPRADAERLIALSQGTVLAKSRFRVPFGGRVWEVDVYSGDNEGLVIAEIELESETAAVQLPPWLGPEVTGEARYYASRLARRSFRTWPDHDELEGRRAGRGV